MPPSTSTESMSSDGDGIDSQNETRVSIVVPAFNAGEALHHMVAGIHSSLDQAGQTIHEVVVVSDGSTDGYPESLDKSDSRLNLIVLERNQGKGAALKVGISATRGDIVCYIDADGDLPSSLLPNMIEMLSSNSADAVLGSRQISGAQIEYSLSRRILSRIFRLWVVAWLGVRVRDSQVGIKAFKGSLARKYAPKVTSNGFAFDAELLMLLQRDGHGDWLEYPVVQIEGSSSSLRLTSGIRALLEVASVSRNHKSK